MARLAGFPAPIIQRAFELLAELEGSHSGGGEGLGRKGSHRPKSTPKLDQLPLFGGEDPLVNRLINLDPDKMTPLEALNVLHALQKELQGRVVQSDREGAE